MPERWLLDTNILLRMFRPEDSRYEEIQQAIYELVGRKAQLCVQP